MKTYLIGCGGSGGWIAQLFAKSPCDLVLVDGDTIEKKNLDRQLFTRRDIGKNKAAALASKFADTQPVTYLMEYLAPGSMSFREIVNDPEPVCLLVAVDNHPCRRLCYWLADERYAERKDPKETIVISAANEYETASAWVYLPKWLETPLDPRVRWPEILTDDEGDPLRPPCTGEVLQSAPQLALSNMLSASAAAWLHRYWTSVLPGLSAELPPQDMDMLAPKSPVWVDYTNGRQTTYTIGDLL